MVPKVEHRHLKEIAESLDCGLICYYHLPSGHIEAWPAYNEGDEYQEEAMQKIDENYQEYLRIPPPESHESFEIMEDFIATVSNKVVGDKLRRAVSGSKPFQRFKFTLLDYPEIRERWFQFKLQWLIQYALGYFPAA